MRSVPPTTSRADDRCEYLDELVSGPPRHVRVGNPWVDFAAKVVISIFGIISLVLVVTM